MDTSGNLDSLVDRVLNRAKEEASSIIDRGKKAAEREVQRAEEKCGRAKKNAETAAGDIAKRQVHSAQAEADQARRRALMNAREEAIESVFRDAISSLGKIDDSKDRLSLLKALVGEAAAAIGVDSVRVRFNAAELALVKDAGFPEEMDGVAIAIDQDSVDVVGGPVVSDDTGRIVFENTFESRLDRNRELLRRLVAEALHLDDRDEGAR